MELIRNNAAYIHPTAQMYGKVKLCSGSSLWPYTVIRSEMYEVKIGEKTNIQDFVMIHIGNAKGTTIGSHCSITHHCTLHGCVIGDNTLIGINSTIMDDCLIGNNCILAGHTFLPQGTVVPDNSIVVGSPGKVTKNRNNYIANRLVANFYYENALAYAQGDHRRWSDPQFIENMKNLETLLKREGESSPSAPE